MKSQRSDISILKEICDVHKIKGEYSVKIRKLPDPHFIGPKIGPKPRVGEVARGGVRRDQIPFIGSKPEVIKDESANTQQDLSQYIINRVELSFKDQFVSRRDMWKITQQLQFMTVYKSKQLEYNGLRTRVRALYTNEGKELRNGIIDIAKTKFSFFSKSSQLQILVEASSDMFSFDHNGHIQTEKAVTFVKSYFDRCLKDFCSNEVSIVIYARLFYPQVQNESQLKEELRKHHDINGSLRSYRANDLGAFLKSKHVKFFQDVFLKVGVYEISKPNQEKSIIALKRALNFFPSLVNWNIAVPDHVAQMKDSYPFEKFSEMPFLPQQQSHIIDCQIGSSEKCQLLEAINLSLFNLNNENMDQNLKKTGHQLVILTAGTGSYRVNADMINPTKSRALLGGTPIQIVSFQMRPPFQTPLLIRCCTYKNPFETQNKLQEKQVENRLTRLTNKGPDRTKNQSLNFETSGVLKGGNNQMAYRNKNFMSSMHIKADPSRDPA